MLRFCLPVVWACPNTSPPVSRIAKTHVLYIGPPPVRSANGPPSGVSNRYRESILQASYGGLRQTLTFSNFVKRRTSGTTFSQTKNARVVGRMRGMVYLVFGSQSWPPVVAQRNETRCGDVLRPWRA